jgi:molybdopterin converting factor subunit 1
VIVKILVFAALKHELGDDCVELRFEEPPSVAQLRRALAQRCGATAALVSHCRIAINEQFVSDETTVSAGAVVACIPPVSGG